MNAQNRLKRVKISTFFDSRKPLDHAESGKVQPFCNQRTRPRYLAFCLAPASIHRLQTIEINSHAVSQETEQNLTRDSKFKITRRRDWRQRKTRNGDHLVPTIGLPSASSTATE